MCLSMLRKSRKVASETSSYTSEIDYREYRFSNYLNLQRANYRDLDHAPRFVQGNIMFCFCSVFKVE